MKEKVKNNRTYAPILLLVLALICFFAALYVTRKTYQDYKVSDKNLKEETAKLENKSEVEMIIKQNEENITKVESLFVDGHSLLVFFDEVKNLAIPLALDIELLSIDNQLGSGVLLNYQASGSFNNIYRLLKLLENMPYYVTLDSVTLRQTNIAATETSPAHISWTASFDLRLLSFRGKISGEVRTN